MSQLVKVNLHGALGVEIGKEWELAVSSVSAAINAIQQLTNGRLYKFLSSRSSVKYRVIINGDDFVSESKLDNLNVTVQDIKNSNLVLNIKNLKSVEIVPVIEGADSVFNAILGGLLIVVGVVLAFTGNPVLGVGLIMIGAGLLASGIVALLAKPPTFDDFRTIGNGAKVSYLFDGPQNVTKEGGPVPVGYGRLLIGSQVISASYVIKNSYNKVKDFVNTATKFYVWSDTYYLKEGDPFYGIPKEGTPSFFYEEDENGNKDGTIKRIAGGYYELNDDKTLKIFRALPATLQWYISAFPNSIDKIRASLIYGPEPDENPFPNDIWRGKTYPYI